MFNDKTWQSHQDYRVNFKNAKARFSGSSRVILHNYDEHRAKLMSMNLDPLKPVIKSLHSKTGRPAKNQAQILRSIILFCLLLNQTIAKLSLTAWVRDVLPSNQVFIALIGCNGKDDLPPLGSYYDMMDRFWNADRSQYSRDMLFPPKNGKLKKDLGTDGKQRDADPDIYRTIDLKEKILHDIPTGDNSQEILQKIFYYIAVLPSLKMGLIPQKDLTMSGDGTAVAVHANPHGRRQKDCSDPHTCRFHDNCPRHYTDPDADWGYDSHEKEHYYGRSLYMFCCRNETYKVEVPVLTKYMSARRHDSIIFFYAIDDLKRTMPAVKPRNFCLDSAHDNIATYELLNHMNINALIDLNQRSAQPETGLPPDIRLNKLAHPVCMANFTMAPWGYDKIKEAKKYRCPVKCGRRDTCPCIEKCSASEYGRTVYIKTNNDLRFFPKIPRDSDEYSAIYKERTACERVNNRVLNDYYLQDMKIRGDDHFSFWTMIIGICIHLDARKKANLI